MKKLVLFLAVFAFGTIAMAQTKKEKTAEVKIKTSAICGMCKNAIEKDLAFEKGVESADLDLKDKVVTVVYNPSKTDVTKIKAAISKVGYDADEVKADEKSYSKLSDCCKKDAAPHHE